MWEGPHSGPGERHEEERVAKSYELTTTPITHPACTAHGREGRRVRREDEPGKMWGSGGKLFLVLFLFVFILLCY